MAIADDGGAQISFLSVPVKKASGQVVGILQLVRKTESAIDPRGFDTGLLPVLEALSAQLQMIIENASLRRNETRFFESLQHVFTVAFDAKSPSTSAHCKRVPARELPVVYWSRQYYY